MSMNNDETISVLNDLIETCRDGKKGYETAAEKIDNTNYRQIFEEYSRQRMRFHNQLQEEVDRLGGDPEDSGSVSGSLHRAWMNIKSMAPGDDLEQIVSECEEGEDAALKNYEEALEKDIPSDVRAVVNEQYVELKKAHDRMRSLELELED